MPEPISAQQALEVAALARIAVPADQADTLAGELSRILAYVDQLRLIDTEGVEPLNHPIPLLNVLREDVPEEGLSAEQALASAPQSQAGFFVVPAVLDDSAS